MRFTIAAGILVAAQQQHSTLASSSKTTTRSQRTPLFSKRVIRRDDYEHEEKDENVLQLLAPLLRKYQANHKKPPPQREEPTFHSPTTTQGVLKNPHRAGAGAVAVDGTKDDQNCDPSSIEPDVGIFSCDPGSQCTPADDSPLGGKCTALRQVSPQTNHRRSWGVLKNSNHKNRRGRSTTTTAAAAGVDTNSPRPECDPAATADADVGALSGCVVTQECVVDSTSRMGGRCTTVSGTATTTTTSPRRHLVVSPSDAGVCLPDHPSYQAYDCDCSGFNNVTGSGFVPCVDFSDLCLGELYPGCDNTCVTVTLDYYFTNFAAPGYKNCFVASTPYSQTVCFEEKFEEATCTLTLNNVTCNSCEIVPGEESYINFDCSNAAGGQRGSTANGIKEMLPILQLCSAMDYCDLCGPSQYVGRDNYELALNTLLAAGDDGTATLTTCGDLTYPAYQNVTIDRDRCTVFAESAQSSGCCVSTVNSEPNYDCSFCGDRMLYEDKMVEILGYTLSCADFTPLLNDTACDLSGPLLAETCCQPEPEMSVAPSAAPVTPPSTSDTSSSAATTTAATMLFSSYLVVISVTVGLAAVLTTAAAGFGC
jgi:hypothetical protein